MPTYEYNRDYPFAAFITNLGKYNEGELIGEWVKFPTTAEEIKAAMDSIGMARRTISDTPMRSGSLRTTTARWTACMTSWENMSIWTS